MVDEPERRAEIDASLRDVYETLFLTSSPTCTKAALNLLGHDAGGLRLPLVEATDEETAAVRAMLKRHGLLTSASTPISARRTRVSSTLRVLPLGGLGEIGKNMTVIEQDGRSSSWTSGCVSRPRRWSASTWCCPISPICASAQKK